MNFYEKNFFKKREFLIDKDYLTILFGLPLETCFSFSGSLIIYYKGFVMITKI